MSPNSEHKRSAFRYSLTGILAGLALNSLALAGTAEAQDLSSKKVILVTCGPSNPWCKVFNERIVAVLKEAGVNPTVLENDLDPVQVVQQMNQAISEKPDLILVEPADDKTLIGTVKKAKAAGVPVLYMDSPADPSIMDDIALQVVADNAALGRFAAQNIIDGLRERGLKTANVLVITGTQGSTMVQDRHKGFLEVMAKAPEYKIVDVQDANWDPVQSGKIAQQLFAKYQAQGGIDAVRAEADYMAIPVIEAAKQAGMKVGVKNDGLIVSGTNCTADGIKAIRAGDMYGTATEDAWTQGIVTAETAIKFLKGETVPKSVVVEEFRVHAPTLEQYAEVCSKG